LVAGVATGEDTGVEAVGVAGKAAAGLVGLDWIRASGETVGHWAGSMLNSMVKDSRVAPRGLVAGAGARTSRKPGRLSSFFMSAEALAV
jgi:hypothetical protein